MQEAKSTAKKSSIAPPTAAHARFRVGIHPVTDATKVAKSARAARKSAQGGNPGTGKCGCTRLLGKGHQSRVVCTVVVNVANAVTGTVAGTVTAGGFNVAVVAWGRPLTPSCTTWLNPLIGVTVIV